MLRMIYFTYITYANLKIQTGHPLKMIQEKAVWLVDA